MLVKEYLRGTSPEQFHIFDSHQESMEGRGVVHGDRDYEIYTYNIHQNNKPKVGDVFLYRRPGKSTQTRKFNFYGGGVIASISDPDREGKVEAFIEKPFKLVTPINQGDAFLESFIWTSKTKKPDSWAHFWNQYGMNVINKDDFYGLVGELECTIPGNYNPLPAYPDEYYEEYKGTDEMDPSGFQIDISDEDGKMASPSAENNHTIAGRHVDYLEQERANQSIGHAGELLVMTLLEDQLSGTGAKIEHTAVEKGDGFGYDIRVIYPDGSETQIEVKTTKTAYVDGFYLTPRELNASRQCEISSKPAKKYQIYRVYNFDVKHKTASIKIYDTPFTDDTFRFVPVSWKVYVK